MQVPQLLIIVNITNIKQKGDLPKILRLPLTEDNYIKHTVDLSLDYYRNIMAAGVR